MEAYGLERLREGKQAPIPERENAPDRMKELVCIGAAFGVNCVTSLEAHLEAAARVGISQEERDTILKLSAFIKSKAASHVERLAATVEKPEVAYAKEVSACC